MDLLTGTRMSPGNADELAQINMRLRILQADVRSPGASTPKWELSADAECAAWSIAEPTQFLVASEDGVVACFDARGGASSAPLFRLAAHDKPTCAISFCPAAPHLLATASADKLVSVATHCQGLLF